MSNPDIFYGTSGPRNADIVIVGDFWGVEDSQTLKPFSGLAGRELKQMLLEAGINAADCFFTSVCSIRPPGNKLESLLFPVLQRKPLFRGLHTSLDLQQGYETLQLQLAAVKPKLIISVGNLAFWALSPKANISTQTGYKLPSGTAKWRGSQLYTLSNIPLLPIHSPASILRSWDLRFITVHDLKFKAKRFLTGELAWTPPESTNYHMPSPLQILGQLAIWQEQATKGPLPLAVDIETYKRKHINCIGICDGTTAFCIPFFYFDSEGTYHDYFSNIETETEIIFAIRSLLSHPNVKVIGQNYIYDHQFLYRLYNIKSSFHFDTMLAQHLLWPGTPKSLDYLASLYCNHYTYWKDESQDWDATSSHQDLWLYNCKDIQATFEIYTVLEPLISKFNLTTQWEWQKQQWQLAADMMQRGVNYNFTGKASIQREIDQTVSQLESFLLSAMPERWRFTEKGIPWHSSPNLQKTIFYDILGFKEILHKKTKRRTLNAESFEPLAKQAPWLSPIWKRLELLRSLRVFNSHFLGIQFSIDGRLRCNFNVGGTDTFRWSSSANGFGEGTNLQNIPKGDTDA